MRVLIYAPNYWPAARYGGPVRSSRGLVKALAELGHEVEVFTTSVDGPNRLDAPPEAELDGARIRYFDIAPPKRFYYAPDMGRALDAEAADFDVVHINGAFLWPGGKAAAAARRADRPYILSPRGMLAPELIAAKSGLAKRAWIGLSGRRQLGGAAAIHVTSDVETAGLSRLGLDLAPMVKIANGVDPPAKEPSPELVDDLWRGAPQGRRVAFLARLDWKKGVDLAVEAALAAPAAHLRIAGPDQDGLRQGLERRISAAGAARRIRFIGPLDEARKWAFLSGADVFLAPSLNENFGIAAAEALALGAPVVCSAGVGAGEIVRRIDAACVVPRRTEALARALAGLLSAPARRAAFGAAAKALMAAEYSWGAIGRDMAQTYAAAIETRAAEATPA
ncbi:MAG: glycosyltransferase [Pseudomonadota bacterium]